MKKKITINIILSHDSLLTDKEIEAGIEAFIEQQLGECAGAITIEDIPEGED